MPLRRQNRQERTSLGWNKATRALFDRVKFKRTVDFWQEIMRRQKRDSSDCLRKDLGLEISFGDKVCKTLLVAEITWGKARREKRGL